MATSSPWLGTLSMTAPRIATVAVHSAGMIEALRKLYGAGALADELQGKQ